MRSRILVSCLSLPFFALAACGDDEETPVVQEVETTVAFRAVANGEPVVFGEQTPGISDSDSVNVYDLRFYVSEIHAIDQEGKAQRARVLQNIWTHEDGVALIDLSDVAEGAGTAGVNNHVTLRFPEGEYSALRFTMGVPFEHNHSDASVAPSPFNMMSMNWGWRGGRLFFRLDATTGTGNGAHAHVGSTGCQGELIDITHCDQPNRSTIEIPWTLGQNVELDLQALYAGFDVNANTEETPALCMGSPEDPECAPFFIALGLPFGDTAAQTQTVFRATDAGITAISSTATGADQGGGHGDHGDGDDHGDHGDGDGEDHGDHGDGDGDGDDHGDEG